MSLSQTDCRGAWVPLVTPFRDAEPDLDALGALVERLLPTGIAGFLALGTTGEAAHCDEAESAAVVRTAVAAAAGRLPVLAGSGRPTTRHTIAATERLAAAGAAGVLVLTPHAYRSRMDGAAFRAHYASVAAAAPVPVFVYHMPGATGVDLASDVLVDLVRLPNVWGFKDSSTEGGPLADTLVHVATRGFVGGASRIVDGMGQGASGAIVAIANLVPELCVRLVAECAAGRTDAALLLQDHATSVTRALAGWGTAGVKAGLEIRGWPGGVPRAPLRLPPREVYDALASALDAALAATGSPPR